MHRWQDCLTTSATGTQRSCTRTTETPIHHTDRPAVALSAGRSAHIVQSLEQPVDTHWGCRMLPAQNHDHDHPGRSPRFSAECAARLCSVTPPRETKVQSGKRRGRGAHISLVRGADGWLAAFRFQKCHGASVGCIARLAIPRGNFWRTCTTASGHSGKPLGQAVAGTKTSRRRTRRKAMDYDGRNQRG